MKKFGYFDDKKREYVITDPKTPYPWINYLGTGGFFTIISNTGGGYSFYKDARLRRITRYRYNNVPIDSEGKYFYIKEDDCLWSPGWKPAKTPLDQYACHHGMGYTKIIGAKNKLKAEVLYFVPLKDHVEIQQVRLTNESKQKKTFKLYSYVEWALWDALADMTNFQRNFSTGEVEVEESVIYHKTEYRERRNHFAFYSVNTPTQGFDTDRETFVGLYESVESPRMIQTGTSGRSIAKGWPPIASHYLEVSLKPGESKDFIFLLGFVENKTDNKFSAPNVINKEQAGKLMKKYTSSKQVDQAFLALKKFWHEMFSAFYIDSAEIKLNRMVNVWNQYQNMITYLFSRSASYFESGIGRGMGFRDSNQDIIGMVHMQPQWARQRIIDLASTQLADGSAYHQYQPLTKKGNHDIGGNFNDDPLWLVFSVSAYLNESGDFSFLDEPVPFENGEDATIFEHIKRAFYYTVNHLGPHGLPFIGRADWNDCLNLNCFSENPDESFQTTENVSDGKAESLLIAGMFVKYGQDFVEICHLLNKTDEADKAQIHVNKMKEAIDRDGWDGNWFLRAYDYYGNKVGSKENAEGKIFIEPQAFCILAGIGLEDGRAKKALREVNKQLATPYGLVLLHPAYTQYDIKLGEISSYPPGYKENGGIFCHNNPWIVIAETIAGNNELAFDYYTRIAPAYIHSISELHKTEPYVYSQMITGKESARPGEAKNSWLTGTSAWNFYAVSQYILGIRPSLHGIIVDPKLPAHIKNITIHRKFRGAVYQIKINNHPGHQTSVFHNGKILKNNLIPVAKPGETIKIIVE